MNQWQADVREFMLTAKQPIGVDVFSRPEGREMRARLIMEEAVETAAALGFDVTAVIRPGDPLDPYYPDNIVEDFHKSYTEPDFPDFIDGVCDTIYVVLGGVVTAGIDLERHWNAVHRANMQKMLGPIRADGKQLKPEGWEPPDHLAILNGG